MHRCLLISELVHLICDEIRTGPGTECEKSRALLALALTSRSWSDAALDCLWYRIEDIDPLFRCMPEDLYRIENCDIYLQRPIENSDLQHLYKYTMRVRYISFMDSRGQAPLDAYHALSVSCRGPILPNLVGLTWEFANPDAFQYINLFLHTGLKHFRIQSIPNHPQHLTLISNMPSLTHLSVSSDIYLDIWGQRPTAGLDVVLSEWRNLCFLEVMDTTLDGLLVIANMMSLRTLKFRAAECLWMALSGPEEETRLLEAITNLETPFPALESLVIETCGPVSTVTRLFKLFRNVKLSKIALSFPHLNDTIDEYAELFQTLPKHCNTTSLKVFKLWYGLQDEPIFPFPILTPLLEFQNLEIVKFEHASSYVPTSVSEQQLFQMCLAWPKIRRLEISPTADSKNHALPPITLSSLLLVASRCPAIKHLGIPINASCTHTLNTLRDNPQQRVKNWSLRSLNVGDSPVRDVEFVSLFLAEVFPGLEEIESRDVWMTLGAEWNSKWNERWQYISQVLIPMIWKVQGRSCDIRRLGEDGDLKWLDGEVVVKVNRGMSGAMPVLDMDLDD